MPVPAQVQLQRDDLQAVTSAEGCLMGLQPGEPKGSFTALFHPGKSPWCALFPHHQQVHVPAGVLTDRAALSPAWSGFSTLAGRGIKVSVSATSSLLPCAQQNTLWAPKHGSVWGPTPCRRAVLSHSSSPSARGCALLAGEPRGPQTHRYPEQNSEKKKTGKGACG